MCDRVEAACERAGRDPGSLVAVGCAGAVVGEDEARFEQRAAAIGREPDELRDNGVAGTVDEAAAKLATLAEPRASERVYLQVLDLADLDHLRTLAQLIRAEGEDGPMTEHLPRLANIAGRAHLLVGDGAVDVELRSDGRLPSDPMDVIECWDELRAWTAGNDRRARSRSTVRCSAPPCPCPRQVFGIGLNYADHAAETGTAAARAADGVHQVPELHRAAERQLDAAAANVDWEVELVVVIGRGGRDIAEAEALDHVAGFCVGQDFSERAVQGAGPPPQFSHGQVVRRASARSARRSSTARRCPRRTSTWRSRARSTVRSCSAVAHQQARSSRCPCSWPTCRRSASCSPAT